MSTQVPSKVKPEVSPGLIQDRVQRRWCASPAFTRARAGWEKVNMEYKKQLPGHKHFYKTKIDTHKHIHITKTS